MRDRKLPQNWNLGIIITLPKTEIIMEKSKEAIEGNLRINQAGFRPNKSCIDHTYLIWIILEQMIEIQDKYITYKLHRRRLNVHFARLKGNVEYTEKL